MRRLNCGPDQKREKPLTKKERKQRKKELKKKFKKVHVNMSKSYLNKLCEQDDLFKVVGKDADMEKETI